LLGIIVSALAFVLIMLVSGNNLPACTGSIIASNIVTKKWGVLLAIMGYLSGLFAEGSLLGRGVYSLMPFRSNELVIIALSVAIVIFLIAHKMRVPQSLSITFAFSILGITLALGRRPDMLFTSEMLLFWVAAFLFAIPFSIFVMNTLKKRVNRRRIWSSMHKIKIALVVASFFAAFTLGANTIGFVYYTLPHSIYNDAAVILAIIAGSILFSGGELRRIGNEIIPIRYINSFTTQFVSVVLVECATLFGIPVSNTQMFTASVYGAGIGYKNRIIREKPAIAIAGTWIGTALVGFFASYLLVYLFA